MSGVQQPNERAFAMTKTDRGVFSRRRLLAASAVLAGTATFAGAARAFDEASKADVNVDAKGVALRGYDPVSYQTGAHPVMGSGAFTAAHEGATYHFSSAANRDTFKADPARYAPAYGGFCAMGVAMERKLDGDPLLYRVVNNRLYLNVSAPVQARWIQDISGNVKTANEKWPSLLGKTPKQTNG